jgi:hypothetical protein
MGKEQPTIYSIIIGVVVLVLIIQWAIENPQQSKEFVDSFCGIEKHLAEIKSVMESISPETMDERSIQIAWDLIGGKEVSDCDLWYFYQHLDEDNRKKLKWDELLCNVNDCLNQ